MTLRAGKLPAAMLAELLSHIIPRDPRVLVGPGIGRDAAVIDLGDRLLVAKTDPVTFATVRIGWYAVNVNANDIACMGARPAWFLATALLPPGGPDTLPAQIFDDITQACAALDIELIGGHTEVTLGLERPIIVGAMLGEASRDEIISGEGIEPGDVVLLTKGIAIEGTALLATESADELATMRVDAATLERARRLLFEPGISVVADARAIIAAAKPRLLHDPTEGGIATALEEMAAAANATIRIDVKAIPVLPETGTICEAAGLDPMGLLASGALLAIVPGSEAARVAGALSEGGVPCAIIGTVERCGVTGIMGAEAPAPPFPSFTRDELARFYDRADGR